MGNAAEVAGPFSLKLSHAEPGRPWLLVTGFSDSTWLGIRLPLDLTPFGGAGCSLRVAVDALTPGVTDANGEALVLLQVPNDRTLVGVPVHQQFAIHDPAANALQFVTSNAGQGTIGGQLF